MLRIRFKLITRELKKLFKVETVGFYILSVISLIAVIALMSEGFVVVE